MGNHRFQIRCESLGVAVLVCIWINLLIMQPTWAYESSGLELNLFVDQSHPDFQYVLDQEPVRLHLTIRNIAAQPIATIRGYSQVELYNHIFVTDPAGVQHVLGQGNQVQKMPPPFFVNDLPWGLAETLPADWVRTVTFADVRQLLPMMRTVPGWYTIEARQSFTRFAASGQDTGLGLLGLLDHSGNWHGTMKSSPLQLLIAPAAGAKFDVRVLSLSAEPLAQVPVKIFRAIDLPTGVGLAEAWPKTAPVTAGTSNFEGRVIWEEGEVCIPRGDYAAVALFHGSYWQVLIGQGDSEWQPGCDGLLARQIEAGAQPGVPIGDFSLFALNSLYLGTSATVFSGSVGVRTASSGPWLNANAEVSFGTKASVSAEVRVYADTLYLGTQSRVYDISFNELSGRGSVLGERTSPLETPVSEPPAFKESEVGTQDISVSTKRTIDLAPGAYKNVRVGTMATLRLTGGIYHVENLTVGTKASIVCLAPTEIRIQKRFSAGTMSFTGRANGLALTSGDLVLYVGGINGSGGGLIESPKAVEVDTSSELHAHILAPNGTVSVGTNAVVTGSLIARDILIGTKAKVYHQRAF